MLATHSANLHISLLTRQAWLGIGPGTPQTMKIGRILKIILRGRKGTRSNVRIVNIYFMQNTNDVLNYTVGVDTAMNEPQKRPKNLAMF